MRKNVAFDSLPIVDRVYRGFKIASMAPAGSPLCVQTDGEVRYRQTASPFGVTEGTVMGTRLGRIAWICPEADFLRLSREVETVWGDRRLLTPGLIDCHTHIIYGGNRADEWEARLGGASYAEIANAGGGILSSVRSTRAASEEELVSSAGRRLSRLLREGVTTIEIKSGYGLDLESELKMLRVAQVLRKSFMVGVDATLLAAHAIPSEFLGRIEEYVSLVCEEIIPAARPWCNAVDAFCENIAFDRRQTEKILRTAKSLELKIKVHAEQLTHTGIAASAALMGALSVDHLEYLADEECKVLAQCGTVAVLLPGAYYCLNEKQKPPVAALRQAGVPIAIASDSNPGSSPVLSLLTIGHMACTLFGLTPEEAFLGITRHAAMALGRGREIGTLLPGYYADLAVWDVERPAEILYGIGHNPCHEVYYRDQKREIT